MATNPELQMHHDAEQAGFRAGYMAKMSGAPKPKIGPFKTETSAGGNTLTVLEGLGQEYEYAFTQGWIIASRPIVPACGVAQSCNACSECPDLERK